MITSSNKSNKFLIVVVGPTAVGKTNVAVKLAKKFNTAILNADSRQVYKEMDIGTAKPGLAEMAGVRHYFVSDRSLKKPINAGIFEREAISILEKEFLEKDTVILSGGSGLYVNAVCDGFDNLPEIDPGIRKLLNSRLDKNGLTSMTEELKESDPQYASEVDLKNPHRVIRALEIIQSTGRPYSSFRKKEFKKRWFDTIKIGLELDRALLNDKIETRMDKMIDQGLFEEAKALYKFKDLDPLQTVGYREVFGYMEEEYSYEEAIRLLKRNSRRYAKRQLTWFRKDSEIKWFEPNEIAEMAEYVNGRLNT